MDLMMTMAIAAGNSNKKRSVVGQVSDPITAARHCKTPAELRNLMNTFKLDPETTPIDVPTLKREFMFQEFHISMVAREKGFGKGWIKKRVLWRAISSSVEDAAIKMLPHVQEMATYYLATCPGNMTDVRPLGSSEIVNVNGEDKNPNYYSVAPRCPMELRKSIALCEESGGEDGIARHIDHVRTFLRKNGKDPDLMKHGDLAIIGSLVGAPMRKGKTMTSLCVLWFTFRMGFKVTYGVAPFKSAVIRPVWNKIMQLEWHHPDFGLVKNPMATYKKDGSGQLTNTKLPKEDVKNASNCNLLIYSIDIAGDVEAMREFVESHKTYLKIRRPHPTCPNSDVEVDVLQPDGFDCAPFVNIRDEVQNAAKMGEEEKREKMQKKEEELQNANANLVGAMESGIAAQISSAQARKGAAYVALQKATALYQKATAALMANLRPTLVNSYGYSVHISATILPTFQEMQMYGTHTLPLPLGKVLCIRDEEKVRQLGLDLNFEDYESPNPDQSIDQDVRVLPPLRPNADTTYVGLNKMKHAEYGSVYTKELVYTMYRSLMRRHFERLVLVSETDEARTVAEQNLGKLRDYLLPITNSLFDDGSFAVVDLLRPNGCAKPTKTARQLVDVAKMLTYIDTRVIGVSPTESIVIKAEHHAPQALREYEEALGLPGSVSADLPLEVHDILPTTVVSVIDKVNSKKQYVSTSFTVARQIVDLLVAKNSPGVVAVWADVPKEAVCREFPDAEFAWLGRSKKAPIWVFHVAVSQGGTKGELRPITNDHDDFDAVVNATRRSVTRKTIENTRFFCVGYGMFTGAITLTTTVDPEDGYSRPLLVCPQTCIYAHTSRRSADSTCQIVGRSCNDIPYDSNYKLALLSQLKTLENSKAYMNAEHRLLQIMGDTWKKSDGQDHWVDGFPLRPSLYHCLTAVSKQLEDCASYDGTGGLGAAALGMKKNTLKTGVTNRFKSADHKNELVELSDDEEVEENMADEDAKLHPLPESSRIDGVPYLFCCAIAWFNDKVRLGRNKRTGEILSGSSQESYRQQFRDMMTAPQTINYPGGWSEIFPDCLPKANTNARKVFMETVVRPVVAAIKKPNGELLYTLPDDEFGLNKQMVNVGAPFWQLYELFPKGSAVSNATPEDFGFASLPCDPAAGPSGVSHMETDGDPNDPDYVP